MTYAPARRFLDGKSNLDNLARLVDGTLFDDARCDIPPAGWRCLRESGHSGPCAAVECAEDAALVERGMSRLRESDSRTASDEVVLLIAGDAPAAAEMLPSAEVSAIPIADLIALLPGVYYMDPPDGGDVSVLEQLRRMSVDARRYRESLYILSAEDVRLHNENQRLRNAIEIIEHTLATLRGEK